ncbi:hypothetical protein [Massilia sp. H6]|uniref:hypothetical protein n=1 Tax=Massilia sp. H6 TaxID=2970464 RepID=UPI0021684583|nr:hypothetical protein [Massilia sp. H6]UVW28416.1 hypothetical protein NRS07_18150 [Massilia sp. H6]
MVTETKDRFVNTKAPMENDGVKRQPHERDETPDAQDQAPRGVIKQAAEDLAQGLQNTDCYGTNGQGLDQAVDPKAGATGQANPLSDNHRSMRRHDADDAPTDKNNL